jgi:phosphoesterase RecJ-like protein
MTQTTNPERETAVWTAPPVVATIRDAILSRQSFLLTSHARPDGDSIGSQLAMAYALDALGKDVYLVNADPAPDHYRDFPGLDRIEISSHADVPADALIVMECSDLSRTGVTGLEGRYIINIDHHAGNRMYGAVNWFDESAAACAEMVYDVIQALEVRLTLEIATHIYLGVLTDTGSFHHSNITARTFDICRRTVEAGVAPATMARRVYDSNSFGKLKLIGAVLDSMQLVHDGKVAVLSIDEQLLAACGCTLNDTEGLINLPLTAREIQAVVFFKIGANGDVRVSLRSKYDVDVRVVANEYGGGGHKNAAGFTIPAPAGDRLAAVVTRLVRAVDEGLQSRPTPE